MTEYNNLLYKMLCMFVKVNVTNIERLGMLRSDVFVT